MKPSKLKLYICIRDDLNPIDAMVAYGHATLGTYLTYLDDELTKEWVNTSFVKVIFKVHGHDGLLHVCSYGDHRIFTESRLGGMPTCAGFRILREHPLAKLGLPLYSI